MDESPGNWHKKKKIESLPISISRRLTSAPTKQACHCERPKEAWQSHKLRLLRLCLVMTLCITFYFSLFTSSVEAEAIKVDPSGDASYPTQRKIIHHRDWGYWVFYDNGSEFYWKYSPDGSSWGGGGKEGKVFSDSADPGTTGSIWYVESDTRVYSASPPATETGKVWVRYGTLQSDGDISWGTEVGVEMDSDSTDDPQDRVMANSKVSICVDTDKKVWLVAPRRERAKTNRNRLAITRGNYGLSGFPTPIDDNVGDSKDMNLRPAIVPAPVAGSDNDDVSVIKMHAGAVGNLAKFQICKVNSSLAWTKGDGPISSWAYESIFADPSNDGTVHGVVVNDGNSLWYFNIDGNAAIVNASVELAFDYPTDADATITMAGGGTGKDLYIVVKSTDGVDIWQGVSPYTNLSNWTKIDDPWQEGTRPNLVYFALEEPYPMPILFNKPDGMYFDRIITSTAPAPGISSVEITNDYLTSQNFEITVTSGTPGPFQTWGNKASLGFSLASSSYTTINDFTTVSSTVTESQIVATLRINPVIDGGPYKVIVFNPDGQSSEPSATTFTILAPTISSFSPQSGGQSAERSINFSGSNYQNWGTTSTVVVADFGLEVSFTSTTYTSTSEFTAHIKVDDDASSGLQTITVTNPDGQWAQISSTFTVTVPSVSISTPAANGDVDIQTQLLDISGTAWITPSTPATTLGAEVRIRRQSDDYCWNGVSFEEELSGEFWNDADGTDWTYPSTTWDDQQDGETYIIQARGRSSDGGRGYNKVERTVKLDADNPILAISDPVDVKKNKQTSIKGQATDTASGISGANKIEIWIKDLTLGSTYWNGSVWVSTTTEQWLQVTSYVDPNWVYTISYPTACWTDGHQYEIGAQAWDRVDHLGSLASTQKFWYDVIAPTATLTMPEDGKWYTSMNEINGTVTDNTLDKDPKGTVWLKVQNQTNNQYLTQASTWTSSATPIWIQTNFRGTGKTREWYFNTSAVVWNNMVDYEVEVYAEDGAVGQPSGPNEQAPPWPTATFTYDESVPESTITSPVADRIYSSGPALEGTALDEYDNLEEIKICLKQYIGGAKYWKGGPDFEVGYDTNSWQVATGTTSWQYTGFSSWEDGQRYRLWSKAYDNAGNVEDVPDSDITGDIGGRYFGYDESAPISSVTFPQHGDAFNETTAPSSITGDATDPINGSGVDQVLVNIRYLPTGTTTYLAWKGLVWDTPGDYEINFDAFPWSVSMTGAWDGSMDGQVIEVRTWSYDKAFPYNSEPLTSQCTFYYDITKPTSTITSPSVSDPLYPYYANISSFTGTAFDSSPGTASGVKQVGVRIKRSSDNYYWNGSTWTATSTFDVGSGTTSWSYTNVPTWEDSLTYTVNSRAEDEAGNFEANFTTFTFTCDKAAPTSDNGVYNSTYDRIDGTASDAGVGTDDVVLRIKRDEDGLYWNVDQSTWTVFVATASWMQATTSDNWANWSVDTSSVTWEDDHYYTHTSKGTDKLGNEEATPPAKGQQFAYTMPATHFGISMSTTVVAGVAEPVTVSALNQAEGVAKSYLGILQFSCPDDPSAILPEDYQFTSVDEGTHLFDLVTSSGVTLFQAGNIVVKVNDSVDTDINGQETILVKNASADYITVTFLGSVTAGTLYDVTATVYDEFDNQVQDPAYGGTVTFYSEPEANASLPADYPFVTGDQGSHSWLVSQSTGVILRTATQTGWKVKVTDTVNTSITGEKTGIIVNVGTPSTFEVKVDTTPVITAGDGRSVYVRVTDSSGNTIEDYDKTIRFDDDDPLTSIGDGLPIDYTFQVSEQGEHTFEGTTSTNTVRLKTKGTHWVKVYQTDIPTREGYHQNIQVDAGAVTHFEVQMSTLVTAGVAEDITIWAKDQFENTNTSYNTTLTFDCSVAPDWNSPVAVSMTNGYVYKANYVAIEKAGTGIWVRAEDASYQGQQDDIEVVAAPTDHLKVFNYPSPVQAGSSGNYVWVEAQDEYNNKYTLYTGTVTFSLSDPQATPPGDYVFQLSDNGSRPFEVILKTVGTNWNIKAWDKYDTAIDTGTQSGRAVTPDSASQFVVELSTNQTVGVRSTIITVEAKDAYGNRDTNYSSGGSTWTITFDSDDTGVTFEPPNYEFPSTDQGYKEFKDSEGYGVTFSTGGTFYVQVRDNQTPPISGQKDNIFVTLRPESDISFPQDGGKYNTVSPPTIWGTYWDDDQVTGVEISIQKDLTPNWYWNESLDDWEERGAGNPYWNTASVWFSSWTYTGISNSKFASGNNYTIQSRAKDNLNNYEATPYSAISFLYDTDEPVTTITLPADGVDRNTSSNVNGTAYDEIIGYDSGLATLKIQVKGLSNSTTEYWDPPGWSGTEIWLGETAGESWALSSTPTWKNGYKYEVRAYHKDEAGNEESPPTVNTFIFDTSLPDSSISLPSDPFYGPGLTMLWGTFVDYPSSPSYSSGVSSMTVRIYCSSGTYQGDYWDGDSWESLSGDNAWQYSSVWSSSWTYTSLSGAWEDGASYIVNSKALDAANNVELAISTATFTYDSTEPQTVLSMPEDDQGGASPRDYESMDSIYGTASDTLPGELSRVEVKIKCIDPDPGVGIKDKYWNSETDDWQDNEYWIGESSVTLVGQDWQFDSSYVDWVSNATGVLYQVWSRAVDKAGNVDTTPDDNQFKLKSPLPILRARVLYLLG